MAPELNAKREAERATNGRPQEGFWTSFEVAMDLCGDSSNPATTCSAIRLTTENFVVKISELMMLNGIYRSLSRSKGRGKTSGL